MITRRHQEILFALELHIIVVEHHLEELVVEGDKWRCYRFKSARFGNNNVRFDEDDIEFGEEDSGCNYLKQSLSFDEQIPLGSDSI